MTRFQADLLLVLVAVIWGFAFVAQKTAMDAIGPFTFVGTRFLLSAVVIAPFIWRELKRRKEHTAGALSKAVWILSGVFFCGVVFQQIGIVSTSVTNAGFLTGLYVIFTPLMAWILFKKSPPAIIWIAALVCLLGVWFMGDMSLTALSAGDMWILGCAVMFGFHTVWVSMILMKTPLPITISGIQYLFCGGVSLVIAFFVEDVSLQPLIDVLPEILYAGVLSGGLAYTLEVVALQHTPPSDAAIILSGEALFGGIGGFLLLDERLGFYGWFGCFLILMAILMVEIIPRLQHRYRDMQRARKKSPPSSG